MRSKLIHEENGLRTFALAFEPGEEVLQGITRFAAAEGLNAAEVTGLGAFSSATLGYFDLEKKDYEEIPVEEQVEALTLVGNIAAFRGEPRPHLHAVLGRCGGATVGGHLLEARVRPVLEVVITESPGHLRRETDEATGLPLLAPSG
ncbi:hypothetical protein RxyAA322_18900 [Rubrobacter xylanophilus]|uniref:PPC domain-containing protein n=1 Tax=Rubrobacter xylanophilus TaxID=49319 RepID=A0A510HJ57_9ACTN|nr:PPC domain-containing DNA-binding protein [Rubrobacter xylanophilus]BBL80036.1 hypothetical protein RxyAA322_18900 [Rubrobacter xylanophilus]